MPLLRGVDLISYDGAVVAVAGSTRVWLAPTIDDLPPGHPLNRFVAAMCLCAHDVRHGLVPGPYTDRRAELYARCLLLPDRAVATAAGLTDAELAERFGVPLEQARAKRGELRAAGGRPRRRGPGRHRVAPGGRGRGGAGPAPGGARPEGSPPWPDSAVRSRQTPSATPAAMPTARASRRRRANSCPRRAGSAG